MFINITKNNNININNIFIMLLEQAQKTLEEAMAMDIDERQQLAMEVYRGKRTGTLGRGVGPVLGKSPPRPSPASVAYHSDDDSLKAYDENPDDSSLTEKPSEISSTDSQVCITKPLYQSYNSGGYKNKIVFNKRSLCLNL